MIVKCSPLLIGTVPLQHISRVSHFLFHKVNFKSLLLLAPRPFVAFDIDSQYVEMKVVCKLPRTKAISLITCLSNWGQKKIFGSTGEKAILPFKVIACNCIDWKLNASVDYLMICCRKLSVMGNMV